MVYKCHLFFILLILILLILINFYLTALNMIHPKIFRTIIIHFLIHCKKDDSAEFPKVVPKWFFRRILSITIGMLHKSAVEPSPHNSHVIKLCTLVWKQHSHLHPESSAPPGHASWHWQIHWHPLCCQS